MGSGVVAAVSIFLAAGAPGRPQEQERPATVSRSSHQPKDKTEPHPPRPPVRLIIRSAPSKTYTDLQARSVKNRRFRKDHRT